MHLCSFGGLTRGGRVCIDGPKTTYGMQNYSVQAFPAALLLSLLEVRTPVHGVLTAAVAARPCAATLPESACARWQWADVSGAGAAQVLVFDRLMDEDLVRGDEYGPFDAETVQKERRRLNRDKVPPALPQHVPACVLHASTCSSDPLQYTRCLPRGALPQPSLQARPF